MHLLTWIRHCTLKFYLALLQQDGVPRDGMQQQDIPPGK